ncbi:hypothetical protein IJM16_01290 [Candidatus Saccharibacteria bacterium]|nr:hypothetical protein [Candidatus Saccharibacteria bacterium]
MDQNWNGAVPQNQNGGNGQMGPSMPPVPNAGMNTPMLTPAMAGGVVPPNPMAAPMPDSGKKSSIIETIILVVVCLIAATAIVLAVMFYMQYNELQTDFETQLNIKEVEAKKEQKEIDDQNYLDQSKLPNTLFTGPSDYGSIGFYYPKTWSVYIESDGSDNSDFVSYFAPTQVNPIKDKDSRYALRFSIIRKQSDDAMKPYDNKVKKGELTAKPFNADSNRISGTLYEGTVDKNIEGMVLVIKVNDKTAILQCDSDEVFRTDFEALIASLKRGS